MTDQEIIKMPSPEDRGSRDRSPGSRGKGVNPERAVLPFPDLSPPWGSPVNRYGSTAILTSRGELNKDFKDLLRAFQTYEVRYLIVGGYAVTHYIGQRYNKDLDILVDSSPDGRDRVMKALNHFLYPSRISSEEGLLEPGTVFSLGIEPYRFDLMTQIPRVKFETAWETHNVYLLENELYARFISKPQLIKNKLFTGRDTDYEDAQLLMKAEHIS